jgi:hypothetical protein
MYSSTLKHFTMILTRYIIEKFFVIEGSSEDRIIEKKDLSK